MKLLSKDGKRTFNLPDKLAQRLVNKGKLQAASVLEEKEPEELNEVPETKEPEAKQPKNKGGRKKKQ